MVSSNGNEELEPEQGVGVEFGYGVLSVSYDQRSN